MKSEIDDKFTMSNNCIIGTADKSNYSSKSELDAIIYNIRLLDSLYRFGYT